MNKKLLVILQENLSELIKKGEVIDRYYNPGNTFDAVSFILINEDKPDLNILQRMVGKAKLTVYNFPQPPHFFRRTLGWQVPLIKHWVNQAVELAKEIEPTVVRTHSNFLEGYLATLIKKKLGIPYVVSLHGIWDEDDLSNFKARLHRSFRKKFEKRSLKNADEVICVYSPIMKYARNYGANAPTLIHNFVASKSVMAKSDWALGKEIKLLTVNRQLPEKNPENILRAVARLPKNVFYTIIGDGILHDNLKALARQLAILDRVTFIRSLPNASVCDAMIQSDIMVSNCHYKGISKTLIEAGLRGLPIIVNRYNDAYQLEEYGGGWVDQCSDTVEGYVAAIQKLITENEYRSQMGKQALRHCRSSYDPIVLEAKVSQLYMDLI